MPRHARPLSVRRVQSLKERGFYCDGGGLYLQVSPTGSKSWVFRYAIKGRKRDMGLGSLATFNLAEARDRARKMRQLVADGIDPIEARASTRGAVAKPLTFRQCAERYVDAHQAGWKTGGKPWLASLENHAFAVLGNVPVAGVDLALVMQVIEPIWTKKPVTANNVRNRIEMILDWAKTRGLRQGENSARWKGHLDTLLPHRKKIAAVTHRAAMPYREVPAFMVELRSRTETSARVLEFQVLTAARSGEVVGAKWDEINLAERIWTVPAARMKAGRPHRVPLSDAALAIVERQAVVRENDFIFPGRVIGQPIGIDASMKPLQKLGYKVTAHGFRSAFRDWAAEQTNFPREVAEGSLAHTLADATERAYQRSDFIAKRRQIMEAWARYIATPAATATAKVIALTH
jgi:integrase